MEGEKLQRKESYRVREGSIRVVDTSLCDNPVDWAGREKLIAPLRLPNVENLIDAFRRDRTSLGRSCRGPAEILQDRGPTVPGADGPRIMQATFDVMGTVLPCGFSSRNPPCVSIQVSLRCPGVSLSRTRHDV